TDIRGRGDDALIDATRRFDRFDLTTASLSISDAELDDAARAVPAEAMDALAFAKSRIEAYHKRQLPEDDRFTDADGVELGSRWTPIDAVGLYVPGGTAAYPSSVLMNALPAKIAGVGRVVMVVPAPGGQLNPLGLTAARLAGVDEIYRVGGAQAVAALAFGTATIRPVDKIVGPGNAYVAEAKRQVFGHVGIDSIAGPSEVLIIADEGGNPDWIAADLLAQAEHDILAQSILITNSPGVADATEVAVERQLNNLPRAEIAAESWSKRGAIVIVPTIADAIPLANKISAEHVELHVSDPESLAGQITNAGALFLGPHTPEAIGDYVGGPNHVLPTSGSARFSSGLSVLDFMKRTSILRCGADQLRALGGRAVTLAEAEGLGGHARSVTIRLNL
ncbi:MAG: histidinol dehydrogenase, partial [Alphaproteobacteria bacterium]